MNSRTHFSFVLKVSFFRKNFLMFSVQLKGAAMVTVYSLLMAVSNVSRSYGEGVGSLSRT